MQDNTKRGERTLFWLKVLFVLFIVLFFANNAFGESMKSMRQESVGLAVAYIVYGLVCGFGFLISSVMFLVYYFSWLHRAIANLRILTKPDFSPIGAIVLTLIPVIGFVLHFWIFNDMVVCQEKCMEERGILKGRFPKKLLVASRGAYVQAFRYDSFECHSEFVLCDKHRSVHQIPHVLHCSRTRTFPVPHRDAIPQAC